MTKNAWLLGVVAVVGLGYGINGGCLTDTTTAPDEKLAERFDELCVIARDHVDSPVRGVKKLGHYMAKHTGDIMADWGNTFAAIEKITDDAKHDARARLARDRIRRPLMACARDWARFSDAVERNPEAKRMVNDFNVRFNRTLEIIFGDRASSDLMKLPAQLAAPL